MRTARALMIFALPLLAIAVAMPVGAQAAPATTPPPAASPLLRTSGSFFGLSVADVDASARWYVEKLGLTVAMRRPRTDETKASMILLQGGGLTVELVQQDGAQALSTAAPGVRGSLYVHGIFKVGVTIDDFDATVAALRARGVTIAIGPWPRNGDQPANVIIRDNAGNYIQLFGK